MDYKSNPQQEREGEDKVDIAFFLMRRNLRVLIGVALVIGVGMWIYNAVKSPIKPKSAGTWSKALGNYLPKTDIDSEPTRVDDSDADEISEQISARVQKITEFLNNATVEKKVEESLDLRDIWMNNELPLAYILCWRRAKIARNLIELKEVDDKTRIFAYNEYIESILTLDALNSQGKLGVPGIRNALVEIGDMFAEFPDDVIKSKANLAYVLAPAHNYFATKDLGQLPEIANQFEAHSDAILVDPSASVRLVKLLSDMYARANYDSTLKATGLRVMEKMAQHKDEEVLESARLLKEQLYFAKVELGTLVDRIQGNNTEARNDVQEFFEGLAANPSSRIEIYQIAVNTIDQFKKLGLKDDAAALATWLGQINSENTVEENRQKIVKAITALGS